MKAQKFLIGIIAIILAIAIAGGVAIFTMPELQTKIADGIVEKSQIYKETCTELTLERARANTLSFQLSSEILAKNELQERYNDMETERDDLLAQINEEYVFYFVESSLNNENMLRVYLTNFTNESPVITFGMYDVNDVLTETFDFTLINFANPENTPNTVNEDDLTELADIYHIKFLDGNVVLSDFVNDDGSALDKPFNVYYEVFRKDTMFDVMQSRIDKVHTVIVDLQNQLAVANERIAELEQLTQQLSDEIDEINRNNNVSVTLTRSNYYLQVVDENNNFVFYLSKRISNGNETMDSFETTGITLSNIDNFKSNGIHTDDTYRVRIEGYNEGTLYGNQYYYMSNDNSIPSNVNLSLYDINGNVFDVSSIQTLARYRVYINQLNHTCYSANETVGTNYNGQDNIIKNINIELVIELIELFDTDATYTQYFDASLGGDDYWIYRYEYDSNYTIAFAKDGSHIYCSFFNGDCYVIANDTNSFELLCLMNGNSQTYETVEIISPTEINFCGARFILE